MSKKAICFVFGVIMLFSLNAHSKVLESPSRDSRPPLITFYSPGDITDCYGGQLFTRSYGPLYVLMIVEQLQIDRDGMVTTDSILHFQLFGKDFTEQFDFVLSNIETQKYNVGESRDYVFVTKEPQVASYAFNLVEYGNSKSSRTSSVLLEKGSCFEIFRRLHKAINEK
jgi:hypothetical protein